MLEVKNLTMYYGRNKALSGLNLHIPEGKIYGFVGPNGAGKTTTMKIIAGLLKPHEGEVFINGESVLNQPERIRKYIGYMPDFFGVYDNLRVKEYMAFFGELYEMTPEQVDQKTKELLELVGLSDREDSLVDTLSRGMKQRLCLARALLHEPKLLLLDEPASGMDPVARIQMKHILKALSERGQTILISSHILPELSEICDDVGIIHLGQMIKEGDIIALEKSERTVTEIEIKWLYDETKDYLSVMNDWKEASEIIGYEEKGSGSYLIQMEGGEASAASLMKQAYHVGDLYHFNVKSQSLEDLFKKAISDRSTSRQAGGEDHE